MSNKYPSIAFVGHSSNLGGAEKSLFEFVTGLNGISKLNLVVFLPDRKGLIWSWYKESNIKTVEVKMPWIEHINSQNENYQIKEIFDKNNPIFLEIINQFKKYSIDLVFSQSIVNIWGAVAAHSLKLPHIWSVREFGDLDHSFNIEIERSNLKELVTQLSDIIYFPSKEVAKTYDLSHSTIISRILYTIPKYKIVRPLLDRRKFKKQIRVALIASLTESKNPMLALRAMNILKKQVMDIKLDIFGVGPLEAQIKKYINEQRLQDTVFMCGHKPRIEEFLPQYTGLISCSPNEAFGRTLSEGSVFNCIPIHPDIPSWQERFTPGINSLEYQKNTPDSLADALLTLNLKNTRKSLQRNLRKLVKNDFYCQKPEEIIKHDMEILLRREYREKFVTNKLERM